MGGKVQGDTLEVILRDDTMAKYYYKRAHVNNKKEMLNLIIELEQKLGQALPKSGWFD